MPASATTLLRLERTASPPDFATPRVLGVDDWAFRRGHRYGTILYDLEHHCVVDLLPDRTPETLADWLKTHPGVEIVSRDRAEAYASGIRQGAPEAKQVTDRWHLVKNLGQALERLLEDKRTLLKQATAPPTPAETEGTENERSSLSVPPPIIPLSHQQARLAQEKFCRRQCRLERYQEVRALFAQGWNISAIARHLDLSPKTVRTFAYATTFPERKERAPHPCRIDAFTAYLQQRWQKGCHNAAALYKEIQERGYQGRHTLVREYLHTLRQPSTNAPAREKVSQRQVAMWTLRRETERTECQQALLDRLSEVCEPFRAAFGLAQRFLAMIRQSPRTDQAEALRQWLQDALSSENAPLRGFALSLKQDQAAVEAGLSLPWSNGAVEGSNNRLKFLTGVGVRHRA